MAVVAIIVTKTIIQVILLVIQIVKSNSTSNAVSNINSIKDIKYDNLQKLYLSINSNMSYLEALEKVKTTGLPYSETDFNQSKAIKIAFKEAVTPQKYAEEGDHINISFDYDRNNNSYSFSTIEYFNHKNI